MPTITAISPNGAGGVGPGADRPMTITGSGLAGGAVTVSSAHLAGQPPVSCEILASAADRLVVRFPGRARFWPTTGAATVTVTTSGQTPATATVQLTGSPSITSWTRLEPRARVEDLERAVETGLEARIHDASWLLARQWQMGEFTGEDGGSPVAAHVTAVTAPIARYAVGTAPADALHDAVAVRAYQLFERRGRVHGYATRDWFDAERQVRAERRHSIESLRKLVERRAYDLFVRRGSQHGYDRWDWFVAEGQIREELGTMAVRPFDPSTTPLETLVECEPRPPAAPLPLNRAADGGLQFLRILSERLQPNRARTYRERYLAVYPIAAPDAPDSDSRGYADVIAGRVIDGERLAGDVRAAARTGRLPAQPKIDPPDERAIGEALAEWIKWYDELAAQSPADAATAWNPERMEYSFSIGADLPRGEMVLGAPEYSGGRLDWHAFVVQPASELRDPQSPGQPAGTLAATAIPTPLRFAGMPALRWWELEDAAVDFGRVGAGAADLARMLLVEFATIYGNDWFSIPLERAPVGAIIELQSLTVTDAFGQSSAVAPFSRSVAPAFRLFELTHAGDPAGSAAPGVFFLPPVLATVLEGEPIEEVFAVRDEMANIAWAIERAVEGAAGRRVTRREDRPVQNPAPAAGTPTELAYRLQEFVPPNWIPLVAQAASKRLIRGVLMQPGPDGKPVANAPAGQLLEPRRPGEALRLHDSELPLTGLRLTRTWQYARWVTGTTHLWVGREKRGGGTDVSSGLRFDRVGPE
jgi:hypothetical protein